MFDYVDGGSYAEITLARNVADLAKVDLQQKVMTNVEKRSMRTSMFGQSMTMPVALGPVGFAGLVSRRGEREAAAAAQDFGIPFCLSTLSICSVEEVATKDRAPIWFQLYMIKDRGFMRELIERVAATNVSALVLTVDLAASGARYRDTRSGMSGGAGLGRLARRATESILHPNWLWDVGVRGHPLKFGNLSHLKQRNQSIDQFANWVGANFDATVSWRDVEWLRGHWPGPIVIKGIMGADDARGAVDAGAAAVIVSNHGGRQLDGVKSTVSVLPGIVDVVDGRVPVLMDGGVRSGLDVLRVLGLGADGCLLGRAWAFALAAKGRAGVTQMLNIIRSELSVAMALTGCTDLRVAGRALLCNA